jgi:hypothetical protein
VCLCFPLVWFVCVSVRVLFARRHGVDDLSWLPLLLQSLCQLAFTCVTTRPKRKEMRRPAYICFVCLDVFLSCAFAAVDASRRIALSMEAYVDGWLFSTYAAPHHCAPLIS